jgi:hypothetical protein
MTGASAAQPERQLPGQTVAGGYWYLTIDRSASART